MNKIQSIWLHINKFEKFDPDSARRGRLLNILLSGVIGLGIIALAISLIVFSITSDWRISSGNSLLLLALVILILGSIGLLSLNQYSIKFASFLFLALLTTSLSFSDTPQQLANGRSLFSFMITIAIASQLLSPTSSFVFAIINSIIVILLAKVAEISVNPVPIFGFFFLALISWLSARSLEQALKDLREINLNLDGLVEQKTHDLAATLSRELALAGRNQAILDSIADGVIVFDAYHQAILANPALSQITGIAIEDLKKTNLSDFAKNEGLSPANQGMIIGIIEYPERAEEGRRVEWGKRTLSLSAARVRGGTENENIGAVAVFRDITQEAELEKMKETFVAVVSHELRTPLNAIIGYVEMLKEGMYGPFNEKQKATADRIMVNTSRLLKMVGDLLDEAQLKAGKLLIKNETFATHSLLEGMHTTMDKIAADKGISLTGEIDKNMPETITGDPQRLQQIIVNLVNNAAKFTDKGNIHVCLLRSDATHWQIEIKDTGIGIPETELPYIFETFRQVEESTKRKHGGFGLGLAIVKQLVELMKGDITVQSEIGKGSKFTVTLPLQ